MEYEEELCDKCRLGLGRLLLLPRSSVWEDLDGGD